MKSLTQEASIGISQASVVDNDEKLKERVAFIHESIGTAAIVEQYIEGRELYVGIIGNQALQALPVWELFFTNMPEADAKRIATDRVKWSVKYQKKYGIDSGPAAICPTPTATRSSTCKRAFRALELSGYARIDLRLDEAARVWVLEANPNPQIAKGEDFADSAESPGWLRGRPAADHQPRPMQPRSGKSTRLLMVGAGGNQQKSRELESGELESWCPTPDRNIMPGRVQGRLAALAPGPDQRPGGRGGEEVHRLTGDDYVETFHDPERCRRRSS